MTKTKIIPQTATVPQIIRFENPDFRLTPGYQILAEKSGKKFLPRAQQFTAEIWSDDTAMLGKLRTAATLRHADHLKSPKYDNICRVNNGSTSSITVGSGSLDNLAAFLAEHTGAQSYLIKSRITEGLEASGLRAKTGMGV